MLESDSKPPSHRTAGKNDSKQTKKTIMVRMRTRTDEFARLESGVSSARVWGRLPGSSTCSLQLVTSSLFPLAHSGG
ncbi:hypothetical protein EVAR_14398_1 [Eumeta japonica]|uniref:Uncharacterized protein n=1 Tax=Eumeta variegata TaxID=151549 RepID=A0A4C1TXH3_EUMVA|nr:hypothetical protein EVAR_14398_1 [Eumeta japonica]